ncbi:MAG: M23 family metallopeptidase [Actinobacteria bacterium]|nr:MAG: M23 family metallopeptidase [Actinomycetota bacterium]
MRVVLAIVAVAVFAAAAVLASTVRPSAATAPQIAVARHTAVPREVTDVRADPAAHGPASDPERLGSGRARAVAVRGLALPIEGAALPTDPELLPGAPRTYRAGYHEGIDFPAATGTPVLAVADGIVLRVDSGFVDWTVDDQAKALSEAAALGYTPAATLDGLRGRQVWIDHGRGIVSRYAHLSAVAPLAVGAHVERGQTIGAVGNSGYEEGGPHLHMEVRVGESYLGEDLAGDALSAAVARAFD